MSPAATIHNPDMPPWQQKATQHRLAALSKIPKEYLLPSGPDHMSNISTTSPFIPLPPSAAEILSENDFHITESYTARSLAQALAEGNLKALDVVTAFCKRAAVAQQLVGCCTEMFFDEAIERAKWLDDEFARTGKPVGPLHGVPISVKDSFKIKGHHTTLGYVSFIDHGPAESNSPLINILLNLGAVLYVKTNLPQTLMTADSENNIFQRVLNPHNPSLSAGGSSGGEGALVAIRGSILGIATDIGGSIRIPALCNGVYGFKPSSYRIPYAGQGVAGKKGSPGIPAVAGPVSNSIQDLAWFMQTVIAAKPWDYDGMTVAMPWTLKSGMPTTSPPTPSNSADAGDEEKPRSSSARKLRIGILDEDPSWPLWPPVRRALATATARLASANHTMVPLAHGRTQPSINTALELAYASFGLDNTQQAAKNIALSGEPLIESVVRTLATMTPKPGGWSLEEVFELNAAKAEYWEAWNKVFVDQQLDCIVGPGAQTTATPHDAFGKVPYTAVWNLVEYPAIIIPYLKADKKIDTEDLATPDADRPYSAEQIDGAPLAIQLVARRYHDEELLEAAEIVNACLVEG